MTWVTTTPEQKLDLVRDAVQRDGLSYGQAAALLGAPGRGSVAGVIERSKRTGRPIVTSAPSKLAQQRKSAADARQKKAPREKPVKKPHQGLTNLVPLAPVLDAQPMPASTVWEALPGSAPIAIADHTNGCRFPIGADLPFLYCNDPVREGGSSYCAHHHTIAFRDPATVKKIKLGKESA